MSKRDLDARNCKTKTGALSWWYGDPKGIDVVIMVKPGTTTGMARLTKRQILAYLKRNP